MLLISAHFLAISFLPSPLHGHSMDETLLGSHLLHLHVAPLVPLLLSCVLLAVFAPFFAGLSFSLSSSDPAIQIPEAYAPHPAILSFSILVTPSSFL
jgi:hypothetical protein